MNLDNELYSECRPWSQNLFHLPSEHYEYQICTYFLFLLDKCVIFVVLRYCGCLCITIKLSCI